MKKTYWAILNQITNDIENTMFFKTKKECLGMIEANYYVNKFNKEKPIKIKIIKL